MSRRAGRGPRWLGETVPVVAMTAAPATELQPLPRAAIGTRAPRRSALGPAGSLLTHALLLAALIAMVDAPTRVPPPPDAAIAMLFEPPPQPAPAVQAASPPPAIPMPTPQPLQPPPPVQAEAAPPAKPLPPRSKPLRPAATLPKAVASPAAPAPPSPTPAPVTSAPVIAAPPPTAPRVLGAISGSCPGAYTDQARRRALQGRVVVRATVAADGMPAELSVATSSGSAQLDRIAVDAVRVCRAFPKGTAFVADIPYVFRLVE